MTRELSRSPRICVVGAGLMGRWHADAAERAGARVTAVVDVRADAARALAGRHDDARVFSRLEEALAERAVDAVHVCTPAEAHRSLADAALDAGAHVLVEKPLAGSVGETEAVLARARERRLLVVPVHQIPFQPGARALLERRDRLGELVHASYRTCSAGGEGCGPEERRRILAEILPHPASLLFRIFGDQLQDAALEVARFTEDDLDLAGEAEGARIDVSISLRGRPTRNELELVGTRASGYADLFHGYAFVERGRVSRPAKIARPFRRGTQLLAGAGANLAGRALRREQAYPGLRELVRRFYAAALDGAEVPIAEAETLYVARLVDHVRGAS